MQYSLNSHDDETIFLGIKFTKLFCFQTIARKLIDIKKYQTRKIKKTIDCKIIICHLKSSGIDGILKCKANSSLIASKGHELIERSGAMLTVRNGNKPKVQRSV